MLRSATSTPQERVFVFACTLLVLHAQYVCTVDAASVAAGNNWDALVRPTISLVSRTELQVGNINSSNATGDRPILRSENK
jgi:hypothetical protein